MIGGPENPEKCSTIIFTWVQIILAHFNIGTRGFSFLFFFLAFTAMALGWSSVVEAKIVMVNFVYNSMSGCLSMFENTINRNSLAV